jgi:hypothetical protein
MYSIVPSEKPAHEFRIVVDKQNARTSSLQYVYADHGLLAVRMSVARTKRGSPPIPFGLASLRGAETS